MKKAMQWIARLAILSQVLLAGCGGGGSDDDPAIDTTPPPIIENSIAFTEDTSLQQNLNGVWISTRTEKYQSPNGSVTSEVISHETIFVMENGRSQLMIQNCSSLAENIDNGMTSLAFDLASVRYELKKDSNSCLTGPITLIGSQQPKQANATLIKVGAAPDSRYDLYGDFSLGTLTYSRNGGSEQSLNIQCYSDYSDTTSYKDTPLVENVTHYLMTNFFDDGAVSFSSESDASTSNYRSLSGTINGSLVSFENEDDADSVTFSAHGRDTINFSFDASYAGGTDASSDSFVGHATLEF